VNKGIIIGIIVAAVIAIGFATFVTNDNAFLPTETDENLTEAEVITPKSYAVHLEEGLDIQTP